MQTFMKSIPTSHKGALRGRQWNRKRLRTGLLVSPIGVLALIASVLAPVTLRATGTVLQNEPQNVVTTSLRSSFHDTVFISNTAEPEWVSVSGVVHTVTQVQIPGNPVAPATVSVQVNLAGSNGVGLTSGDRYRVQGNTTIDGTANLPGAFEFQWGYKVIPGNPVIHGNPVIPGNPIMPMTVSVALDANGTATAASAQPSLAGWWQAEGDAADASGWNPGTLVGNVTFVPGRVGSAFHIEGAGTVEAPASATLEPQTVTVVLWMRAPFSQPSTYLLSKGAAGCNSDSSYALYTAGDLFFYVSGGAPGTFSPSPPASADVWDGQWHHVAGTYDGATVRLYVDGVEQGAGNPAATSSINYALADNNVFRIGGYRSSCVDFLFSGDIDEVQVFSRALTASEIAAIYSGAP